MIYDIVVDTLFEENVQQALQHLGGRLLMDPNEPEEPRLIGSDGYLVVRIKDRDPIVFSRELERRVAQMRIVKVVERTPAKE